MKKALVILLAILLLLSIMACGWFGVASDTSECGYSQHPGLCTDTTKIEVQMTAAEHNHETATAEAQGE